jgi:hypothetical protein
MKNQVIYALIVLQVITTGFWFSQVKSTNANEASCQMKMVVQTRAITRILNDINTEWEILQRVKAKTTYRPKVIVSK